MKRKYTKVGLIKIIRKNSKLSFLFLQILMYVLITQNIFKPKKIEIETLITGWKTETNSKQDSNV